MSLNLKMRVEGLTRSSKSLKTAVDAVVKALKSVAHFIQPRFLMGKVLATQK